jgi:hypothetical protein
MSLDEYNSNNCIFEKFKQLIIIKVYINFDINLKIIYYSCYNKQKFEDYIFSWSFTNINLFKQVKQENIHSNYDIISKDYLYDIELHISKKPQPFFMLYFGVEEKKKNLTEIFESTMKCFTDLHTFLNVIYGNGDLPTA